MYQTLIEHAENKVDRDQSSEDEDWCAAQRRLKRLCAALEACGDRSWQMQIFDSLLDCGHGRADRDIRGKVEAQRHRWELALVVYRDRSHGRGDLGELAERHFPAAGRCRIESPQRVGPELEIGFDLEDHEILVEPCIDTRRDPLAKGIIKNRINDRWIDTQLLRELAVDIDFQKPPAALLVASYVG